MAQRHLGRLTEPKAPQIPAAEARSFLKQTKGWLTWTVADLAKTLNLPVVAAKQMLAVLEMQGYVRTTGNKWQTTPAGEALAGATNPRFTRESVERALKQLAEWITVVNHDPKAAYRITAAVAFGDFLNEQAARLQAADVGVRLEPRKTHHAIGPAEAQEAERVFLRHLRGRSPVLNLIPYQTWMKTRTHHKLV
jgi:hypothetical protein